MKKYLEVLNSVDLFNSISQTDLEQLLHCLDAKFTSYKKGSMICLAGDDMTRVGVILFGYVQIIKEDFLGNRTILTQLSASDIFGETFACAGITKSPVDVLAVSECEVLFINYKKIVTTCGAVCAFHVKLIENMLHIIAAKNIMLNQKIDVMAKRTIREKLLAYFAVQMECAKSSCFSIPFTRHELADFLCVDRSAMSRELCKMRNEGILQFNGNHFTIQHDFT